MDILDIIIAKKLSADSQSEAAVARANKAVREAAEAVEDAQAAIQTVEGAAEAATEAAQAATDAIAHIDEAIQEAIEEVDIDGKIKSLSVDVTTTDPLGADYRLVQLQTTYPDSTVAAKTITKLYKTAGTHIDGTMTQKAIKDYIDSHGGGGGGSINFGPENAGHIITVDADGAPVVSEITTDALADALIIVDAFEAEDAVGIEADYENKIFKRTQLAAELTMGTDFDQFPMYGGRMRCNVADDGTINAFYGDPTYTEDGSNGQVMVYQPKFYYKRLPTRTEDSKTVGKLIRKESIIVSGTKQAAFKCHPLFINENGEELNYVLLPAFEATTYDASNRAYRAHDESGINFNTDMLASVAGVKPVGGVNNVLTPANAERLAVNRGEGWHITNMAAEAAMQMLEIVEFGSPNGQAALGSGICSIDNQSGFNCASNTGSTSGNGIGAAASTINEINGVQTAYTTDGKVSINYRGVENPWGNIWKYIGGAKMIGNGSQGGGIPYICSDFDYDNLNKYNPVGFGIPSVYGWISAFGYGNKDYDWVFMPAECSNVANSALPIGDELWSISNLNGQCIVAVGGTCTFGLSDGPFYYGCDRRDNQYARHYGARLMFIPTKNEIYEANCIKWQAKQGG